MKSLKIFIQTLTPLWTGGVNNTADRLYETGIIGSLRWWYEAIVRGLEGDACDPTKHECEFKREKYKMAIDQGKNEHGALREAKLCDVCRIFGATGWRRRFDLRVIQDETGPAWDSEMMPNLNIRPPERSHGWFLPAGRIGNFKLDVRGNSDTIGSLAALFLFLEKWGALGAKSQLGYGIFKIINRDEVQECSKNWQKMGHGKNLSGLPDLRQFAFFRFRFKPSNDDWWTQLGGLQRLLGKRKTAHIISKLAHQRMVPVSPTLKNQWRFKEWQAPYSAKRWLLGASTEDDRLRSKVAVSWAYRDDDVWIVRGWAWMPEKEKRGREVLEHGLEINSFEKFLRNESIWKKTLNLGYTAPTSHFYIDRLKNSSDIIKFMEGIKT